MKINTFILNLFFVTLLLNFSYIPNFKTSAIYWDINLFSVIVVYYHGKNVDFFKSHMSSKISKSPSFAQYFCT